MMTIYRIQNEKGVGPFQGGHFDRFGFCSGWTDQKPNPYSEGLEPRRDYYFGFLELRQLLTWFSPHELATMTTDRKEAWIMAVYKVADKFVQYSTTQAMFKLRKADLVAKVAIEDIDHGF